MVHDDWPITVNGSWLKKYLKPHFTKLFKVAKRRFSVSPYMSERYQEIYGEPSDVLYPVAIDTPPSYSDPKSFKPLRAPLAIGFAGSLWNGYPDNLIRLCHATDRMGIKVIAFTNRDMTFMRNRGLTTSNLEMREFIPAAELIPELRHSCQMLFFTNGL